MIDNFWLVFSGGFAIGAVCVCLVGNLLLADDPVRECPKCRERERKEKIVQSLWPCLVRGPHSDGLESVYMCGYSHPWTEESSEKHIAFHDPERSTRNNPTSI